MTENNGFNGPADRDEETQMLENPVHVARVRQDLQAALDLPEGAFRSRRADIMARIRAEAAQARPTPPVVPPPVFDSGPEERTQQFRPIQEPPTQQFTVKPNETTQRFNMPPVGPAQPFNAAQPEPTQRFNGPPPEPTQRFAQPPQFVPPAPPPAPVSLESHRVTRRASRMPAWVGALAAAIVVLVIAGVVFTYLANNNKNATVVSNAPEATFAGAATTAAATAKPPVAASAPQPTATGASGAGGAADSSSKAAATTAAATTAASSNASLAGSATTAATATTSQAGAASGGIPGSVTPAPFFTSGPAPAARTTGLPPVPGSTPINSLGSGRPIQFILDNLAAKAFPNNAAARQVQGLDSATINRYRFSGSKLSGLHGDDVITFYKDQAPTAGYKIEGITPLQDSGDGNKMTWIYLSKGTDHAGILVVDSNDTETGSTFGLSGNETGIYIATT